MAGNLFLLVWTKPSGTVVAGEPTTREQALAEFDNCHEIRAAASRGRGRLAVLRTEDYHPAGVSR